MRSSMRKSDPGFATRVYPAIVTVDGTPVRKCFTADEELGEAWCYVTNENGAVQRAACGKRPAEICIRGKVVITPCPHR
jgi:hypothetical protein